MNFFKQILLGSLLVAPTIAFGVEIEVKADRTPEVKAPTREEMVTVLCPNSKTLASIFVTSNPNGGSGCYINTPQNSNREVPAAYEEWVSTEKFACKSLTQSELNKFQDTIVSNKRCAAILVGGAPRCSYKVKKAKGGYVTFEVGLLTSQPGCKVIESKRKCGFYCPK